MNNFTNPLDTLFDLTFDLDDAARDRIVNHLIEFLAILKSEYYKLETKEAILTENDKLIDLLINMMPANESRQGRENRIEISVQSCELALSYENKNQIINLLIRNRNFAFVGDMNARLREVKDRLHVENRDLIKKLSRCSSRSQCSIVNNSDRISAAPTIGLENENSVSIRLLSNTMEEKRTFNFAFEGVEEFFSNGYKNRYSEQFFCRSIPWCLMVGSQRNEDAPTSKYLEYYLHCQNQDQLFWSIEVYCELRILHPKSSQFTCLVRKISQTFKKATGFGFSKFISIDQLCRDKYIDKDTIQLQVYLNCGHLNRSDMPI